MNNAGFPRSIDICEVGPRDGLQIEPTMLSVKQKLDLLNALTASGLREIEVGSFVNPRAVPQMADTDEVFTALKKAPSAAYRAIWLNARGLERALANGCVDMDAKLAITASETFVQRNTNRSIEDTFGEIPDWIARYRAAGVKESSLTVMAAFGCNFEGRIPVDKVVGLIDRAAKIAAGEGSPLESVCLADTMGWANPLQVKTLVSRVRDAWPDLTVKLHLHDTRGCAVANAIAGMEVGVRAFDSAIGGLGGCPFAGHKGAAGNICTEDLVFACDEMGIYTGIDLDALIDVARALEITLGHQLPGKVMKGGSLAHFERQTPIHG